MYGNYYYGSPYQQRLAQLECPQNAPQQPTGAPMLKGRVVASMEEARASQVDFDGSTTYFVCPGESKIYAKSIGLNGLPVFNVYELVSQQSTENDLMKRLELLEQQVKEMQNVKSKPDVTTE